MIIKRVTKNPQLPPEEIQRKKIGLGDIVAAVAQPTAVVIDAFAGTSLAKCPSCGQRKDTLNKLVPDLNPINIIK